MYFVTVDFGYKQLQTHPRSRQCPLLITVVAHITLRLSAGPAQWKEEFATVSVGQDGVEQFAWWLDFALDDAEIR